MPTALRIQMPRGTDPRTAIRQQFSSQSFQDHFFANFSRSWYGSVTGGFLAKSEGKSDSLGQSWLPLSAYTIHKKLAKKSVRGLNPRQRAYWTYQYKRELSRMQAFYRFSATTNDRAEAINRYGSLAKAIRVKATQKTWEALDMYMGIKVPINIDTDATHRSLTPGLVSGTEYLPSTTEQLYERRPGGVQLGSQAPNAIKTHLGTTEVVEGYNGTPVRINVPPRPIFPDAPTMRPWVKQAASHALARAFKEVYS